MAVKGAHPSGRPRVVLSSTNATGAHLHPAAPVPRALSSQPLRRTTRTRRAIETKTCGDCHVSAANDNNATRRNPAAGNQLRELRRPNAWLGEEKTSRRWSPNGMSRSGSGVGSTGTPILTGLPPTRSGRARQGYDLAPAGRGLAWCARVPYAAEGAGGNRVYDIASIATKGVSQHRHRALYRSATTPTSPRSAPRGALTNQPINPALNTGECADTTRSSLPPIDTTRCR
jgi:hypothetical protein